MGIVNAILVFSSVILIAGIVLAVWLYQKGRNIH